MIKHLLFLLGSIVWLPSLAQDALYIIHIKGSVVNSSTHRQLKVGDALKSSDKISFNPQTSSAVLMSAEKGRFTIGKPQQLSPSASGEFITFVKNTLIPITSAGNLSTRGLEDAPCIENLNRVLGNDVFVFPDDKAVFCMDNKIYPMNENNMFVYRTHDGNKETNFIIPYEGDNLFIEKAKFHIDELDHMPKKADIYYYNKQENTSVKITTISPKYISANELEAEISFLVKLYKKQKLSREETLNHIVDHVQQVYEGRTDIHMIDRWVREKKIL